MGCTTSTSQNNDGLPLRQEQFSELISRCNRGRKISAPECEKRDKGDGDDDDDDDDCGGDDDDDDNFEDAIEFEKQISCLSAFHDQEKLKQR